MHPDTLAAVRLLVLAFEAHPEDIAELSVYGDIGDWTKWTGRRCWLESHCAAYLSFRQ